MAKNEVSKGTTSGVRPEAPSNRRKFVKKMGIAGAAIGAASVVMPPKLSAQTVSDIDILNFALNLEYLEAEFYTVATTGQTIDAFGVGITGSGNAGATTGGSMVPFSPSDPTVRRVAEELATDERTHVALLQNTITALGGTPIAKPAINLGALGVGFGSESDFLVLARVFEEIGVTAYGGAAPLLTSKTVLGYAARILAVEAEHTGTIRELITRYSVATTALDGVDVIPPPSGVQAFSTDSSALTAVRTPGQVLFLAFGGAASATAGGFFPSGVNGNAALGVSSAAAATNAAATLTASPNPIPTSGAPTGITTLSWSAPNSQYIQVRVGSPTGPLFTTNFPTGSMATNNWVTDGMVFFLQDISNGDPLTANNTLAQLVVHLS